MHILLLIDLITQLDDEHGYFLSLHQLGRPFELLVFLYVLYRTFTSKEHVADNYWGEGATTLEWSVSSPPPFHTYAELPRIR